MAVISLLSLTACGDAKTPEKQPVADPTIDIQDETLSDNMTQIDAFADFEYELKGISPIISLNISEEKTINDVSVTYVIQNPKDVYENGDVVTIEAVLHGNKETYTLKEQFKDIIIETQDYYIKTAEEITTESMDILRNAADAALDEYTNRWKESGNVEFNDYKLISHEFWFTKESVGATDINHIVFYYQINANDKNGNDVSSVTYIMFTNIIQNSDGTQHIDTTNHSTIDMPEYEPTYPTMTDLTDHLDRFSRRLYNIESYIFN